MRSQKVEFTNHNGYKLSARLELPIDSHPVAYAIFAHVFTGNKSLSATRHISRALSLNGIGVLRFDFTGLGQSEGDFADTTFTSNVEDLLAAARFLEENYQAPKILVGHSLGGAAVIFAAKHLESINAVATIGAPSEPEHVTHLLSDQLEEIEATGVAKISVGGREFTIKKDFLDDLRQKNMFGILKNLRKAIMVLHSPQDQVVEIDNAAKIYHAAHHPKSFITLDGANHMLTNKDDAFYAGNIIASWVKRYIEVPEDDKLKTDKQVVARLGETGYTTEILACKHGLIADESETLGGNDFGPSPYELLNAALGACTAMTLEMYARRKKWDLQEVKVHLSYAKNYKEDCESCESKNSKLDHFEKVLEFRGNLTDEQKARLIEIANRCPVHRTLEAAPKFSTTLREN